MNNNKSVIFLRDQHHCFRVVIEAISTWEGFDKLINYLERNYQAKIIESYDGPDARRWIINIDEVIIELIHNDDYGNYLLAPTVESEFLLYKIGEDLENRLKKI